MSDVEGATFVIACTGHLHHLYRRCEGGCLVMVKHGSLPAFTVDACLKVIVGTGHKTFTVHIMGKPAGEVVVPNPQPGEVRAPPRKRR